MTGPYVYTDPDGDRLELHSSNGDGVVISAYDTADGESTCISLVSSEFEKFVRALYETARLPVPVLSFPIGTVEQGGG